MQRGCGTIPLSPLLRSLINQRALPINGFCMIIVGIMPNRNRKTPAQAKRPRRNLHARLAQNIGARILSGEFAPGDLLPNEATWSSHFGASRTAVREAIKTLGGKGLLVSRPKIGSRVEPRERWNLLDRDVIGWLSAMKDRRAFLVTTQEARALLEPGIAALAAAKHNKVQLARLQAALEGMRQARSGAEMVAPDVQFHLALILAANNELLVPFGIIIEQALGLLFAYTSRHNPKPHRVIPLHAAIVDAVAAGDPEAARRAASRLIDDTNAVIAMAPKTRGHGRSNRRSGRRAG